eukprot:s1671_g7.t1
MKCTTHTISAFRVTQQGVVAVASYFSQCCTCSKLVEKSATGERTWEPWFQHESRSSPGRFYYINVLTGDSVWDPPTRRWRELVQERLLPPADEPPPPPPPPEDPVVSSHDVQDMQEVEIEPDPPAPAAADYRDNAFTDGVASEDELPRRKLSTASVLSCTHGSKGVRKISVAGDPWDQWFVAGGVPSPTSQARQTCGQEITWIRGPLIGRGSLGRVFKAVEIEDGQSTGRILAVKEESHGSGLSSACCLSWALGSRSSPSISVEQIRESCLDFFHSELIEDSATCGLILGPTKSLDQDMTSADALTRMGQLLCRWATSQIPPLQIFVGVDMGWLQAVELPKTGQMSCFGSAQDGARRLCATSIKDGSVHLSLALSALRFLPMIIGSTNNFYLEAFTEVLEDDDESEASVLGNKDQTMFAMTNAVERCRTCRMVHSQTAPLVLGWILSLALSLQGCGYEPNSWTYRPISGGDQLIGTTPVIYMQQAWPTRQLCTLAE